MEHEAVHAFAAGYEGTRAIRTWQERMKVLEQAGLIKTIDVGNQKYKYVAIIHPTTAIQKLRDAKKVSDKWWNAYIALKVQTREATHEERQKKIASARKVVPIVPSAVKIPVPKKSQSK